MCPISEAEPEQLGLVRDIHTQLTLGLTSCGEAATLAGLGLFFSPSRVSLSTMCHVLVIGPFTQLWRSCLEPTRSCFLSPG